jgi:glycosyltransferase involved in cell wall biosynthesis
VTTRDGYRVIRRSGRYMVFPRSALSGLLGRRGRPDGLVEVWNGMPFFSPVWARCPRVVLVHHVHAEMWRMVLTPKLARLGETIELKVAPRFYRRSRVVTVSESSRNELVTRMGFDPDRITLATGGIDERFEPSGRKSRTPLVLAVGRLVPVKRFDLLIDALVDARRFVPNLEAIIVGEGYERPKIEAQLTKVGAGSWIHLAGYVPDDDLLDLYRRAWVVTSTSAREGWNLTITEAGACGTPAVASAVVGHQDNIRHEVSGLLATPGRDFTAALVRVLTDDVLRERLSHGAIARAREFTWDSTAGSLLSALVEERRARG